MFIFFCIRANAQWQLEIHLDGIWCHLPAREGIQVTEPWAD